MGNLVFAIAKILDLGINLYIIIIIIRAVLSWLNPNPYSPGMMFLIRITEPVLCRIRRFLPLGGVGLDLSPILAILGLMFVQYFLVSSLYDLSFSLR
ncbi:MAG: YggT family protein [Candidatus Zixiibacteriota bacterium]